MGNHCTSAWQDPFLLVARMQVGADERMTVNQMPVDYTSNLLQHNPVLAGACRDSHLSPGSIRPRDIAPQQEQLGRLLREGLDHKTVFLARRITTNAHHGCVLLLGTYDRGTVEFLVFSGHPIPIEDLPSLFETAEVVVESPPAALPSTEGGKGTVPPDYLTVDGGNIDTLEHTVWTQPNTAGATTLQLLHEVQGEFLTGMGSIATVGRRKKFLREYLTPKVTRVHLLLGIPRRITATIQFYKDWMANNEATLASLEHLLLHVEVHRYNEWTSRSSIHKALDTVRGALHTSTLPVGRLQWRSITLVLSVEGSAVPYHTLFKILLDEVQNRQNRLQQVTINIRGYPVTADELNQGQQQQTVLQQLVKVAREKKFTLSIYRFSEGTTWLLQSSSTGDSWIPKTSSSPIESGYGTNEEIKDLLTTWQPST